MNFDADLDQKLLQLTPTDYLTARSAMANILITGGTGSAKTTTGVEGISKADLLAGMGMLVLCYKTDEAALWVRRCNETGRSNSLLHWSGTDFRFNFISYYLSKYGAKGINSAVECIVALIDTIRLASPSPGRPGEAFWTDAIRGLLRNALPPLYAALGNVTIRDLIRFIRSAPLTEAQMRDPAWQKSSFFFEMFEKARHTLEEDDLLYTLGYWSEDFARLDPKTRSNILISLTTALGRLSSGLLNDLFCTDTNIAPDLCFDGAVIVMDFPPAVLGEYGMVAQLLFKYFFQEEMLARNSYPPEYRRRFIVLVMDEGQRFITPRDAQFLAVCRSSRIGVLFITQSLPGIIASIGGDNPQHSGQQFISNFGTKVWFANSCVETNTWAANTIGRGLQRRGNVSQGQGASHGYGLGMGEGTSWGTSQGFGGSSNSSSSGAGSSGSSWNSGSNEGGNENRNRSRNSGSNWSTSQGYSEQMDFRVEPGAFATFKTGGSANGGVATCIWYENGRQFSASGDNALYLSWQQ
jgi:hypothetical protein